MRTIGGIYGAHGSEMDSLRWFMRNIGWRIFQIITR